MQVTVTAKTPIPSQHREHVREKIMDRLDQMPEVQWVALVVDKEASRVERWSIQARVGLRHGQLNLHGQGESIPQAIELIIDSLDRRLAEHRHRVVAHKGHSSVRTLGPQPLASV